MSSVVDVCPKTMVYGPCQGVHQDGACELGDRRCVFLDLGVPAFSGPPPAEAPASVAAEQLLAVAERRPIVIAELVARADVAGQQEAAARLAGAVDAALLGDAPWERVQLPPVLRATLLLQEGVRPIVGLTCRDRNRVALEGELQGLAAVGVPMVLCLTGDHPSLGDRADAAAVFDLDSTRLAALAAGRGMIVAVAESASVPPVATRPARVASKAAAGATVCFVNHGSADEVERFVDAARVLTPSLRFVVSVPVAVSDAARGRLAAFLPGSGGDPLPADGVAAAVATAERLLRIDGVIGVDLSAAAGEGEEALVADRVAEVATALGGGS